MTYKLKLISCLYLSCSLFLIGSEEKKTPLLDVTVAPDVQEHQDRQERIDQQNAQSGLSRCWARISHTQDGTPRCTKCQCIVVTLAAAAGAVLGTTHIIGCSAHPDAKRCNQSWWGF